MDEKKLNEILLPISISKSISEKNKERLQQLSRKITLSGLSINKKSKLHDLLMQVERIQIDNFKSELCFNVVKSCVSTSKHALNTDKLNDIVLSHELEPILTFSNGQNVLGLSDFNKDKLTLEESSKLKIFVADKIKMRHEKLFSAINETNFDNSSSIPAYRNVEGINSDLLALKVKLNNLLEDFIGINLVVSEKMKNLLHLCYENNKQMENKMGFISSEIELLMLKQSIIHVNLQRKIFKETPEKENAVALAIKDLRKETEKLSKDSLKMENELTAIQNILKSDAGALLKKYLSYVEGIKQTQCLIEEMRL